MAEEAITAGSEAPPAGPPGGKSGDPKWRAMRIPAAELASRLRGAGESEQGSAASCGCVLESSLEA